MFTRDNPTDCKAHCINMFMLPYGSLYVRTSITLFISYVW